MQNINLRILLEKALVQSRINSIQPYTLNKAETKKIPEGKNGDIRSSWRKGKKAAVYMDGTWYHFGDDSMGHNYSKEAREKATARHAKNLKGDDPRSKAFRVYWNKYWKEGGSKKDPEKAGNSDEPCWDGYEQIGMKEKNGKKVPNCVPKGKK